MAKAHSFFDRFLDGNGSPDLNLGDEQGVVTKHRVGGRKMTKTDQVANSIFKEFDKINVKLDRIIKENGDVLSINKKTVEVLDKGADAVKVKRKRGRPRKKKEVEAKEPEILPDVFSDESLIKLRDKLSPVVKESQSVLDSQDLSTSLAMQDATEKSSLMIVNAIEGLKDAVSSTTEITLEADVIQHREVIEKLDDVEDANLRRDGSGPFGRGTRGPRPSVVGAPGGKPSKTKPKSKNKKPKKEDEEEEKKKKEDEEEKKEEPKKEKKTKKSLPKTRVTGEGRLALIAGGLFSALSGVTDVNQFDDIDTGKSITDFFSNAKGEIGLDSKAGQFGKGALGGALIGAIGGPVGAAVGAVVGAAAVAVSDNLDEITAVFDASMSGLSKIMEKAVLGMQGLWDEFGPQITASLQTGLDFVTAGVSSAIEGLHNWWEEDGLIIKSSIQTGFDNLRLAVTNAIELSVDAWDATVAGHASAVDFTSRAIDTAVDVKESIKEKGFFRSLISGFGLLEDDEPLDVMRRDVMINSSGDESASGIESDIAAITSQQIKAANKAKLEAAAAERKIQMKKVNQKESRRPEGLRNLNASPVVSSDVGLVMVLGGGV